MKPRTPPVRRPRALHARMRTTMRIAGSADLPTKAGRFRIVAFERAPDGKEHVALVRGDVAGRADVPIRIHSECLTGDGFGSLRCDCRDQLEASMLAIGGMERGVILYLRQEGRGIGLLAKVRAYALQDEGLDTIQANEALGFRPDERDYGVAAGMLEALDVGSVRLMSNNPHKFSDLAMHGVRISGRIPLVTRANEHNRAYLETKRTKSGHLVPPPDGVVPGPHMTPGLVEHGQVMQGVPETLADALRLF